MKTQRAEYFNASIDAKTDLVAAQVPRTARKDQVEREYYSQIKQRS